MIELVSLVVASAICWLPWLKKR